MVKRLFAASLALSALAGCQLILGFEDHVAATGGGGDTGGSGAGGAPIDAGKPCATGEQCVLGYCVDGFCCNEPCDGTCLACAKTLTGKDDGSCAPALAGSDPHDDCTASPTSCDADSCSGDGGACAAVQPGTSCGEPTCEEGTSVSHTCDANGACSASPTTCEGFQCVAGACLSSCDANDALCDASHFCMGTDCAPDLASGEGCTRAAQCASDVCVDDVCCKTACDGQCEACGPDGTCDTSALNGVDDPDHPCPGNQICCDGDCKANCP